jgi:hypothetical protein
MHYAVIDGTDGRAHNVRLRGIDAERARNTDECSILGGLPNRSTWRVPGILVGDPLVHGKTYIGGVEKSP